MDASQYAHTAWKVRDGFSQGVIDAIAQTPDGYLWQGTEFGLLRFDGVRNVPWQPPSGEELPNNYVRSLLATRDGTLWIGTSKGLASWKGSKLTRYSELDGQSVGALLEDREGTVWAGGEAVPSARLCAIRGSRVECSGDDGAFGQFIDTLHEDRAGNLWVGGTAGLWRWRPGAPQRYPMPDRVQAVAAGDGDALLVAMLSGVRRFAKGRLEPFPVPTPGLAARCILRDRDGGLWIGTTDRGLVHMHRGRTDYFERSDGLSGDFIERLMEDREGNIWVATIDGLDRFRDLAVPTMSVKQGLSNATVVSVLAGRDGSMWLGTLDGLNRWDNGKITVYRNSAAQPASGGARAEESGVRHVRDGGLPDNAIQSLFQDFDDRIWVATRRGLAYLEGNRFTRVGSVPGGVEAMEGDQSGNLWVSQTEKLFHLRDRKVVETIPWSDLGQPEQARSVVNDPVRGGLWLSFHDHVLHYQDGKVRSTYTVADGLGKGHIRDLRLDGEGVLWAATERGVSRIQDGRIVTLTSKGGLPCDDAHWVMEDDHQTLWIYMACGLVRVAKSEFDAWAAGSADQIRQIRATLFDGSDGVRSHSETTGFSPSVAKSRDGKLWFLPWDGVSVVDPRHIPFNRLIPPVHIEQVRADSVDHKPDAAEDIVQLPARVRNVEIDYTATSFVAPEKVRFRYMLEKWDEEWQEAGGRRRALYSNLTPGEYRFRVMAANESGVWNEAGTSMRLAVAPAYYQTTWFQVLCGAAFLAALGLLYELRLRQLARQLNVRMEERVNERTRIARDLHDTLLQSFQGVLLRFSALSYLLPDKPAEAKQLLESAVEQARQAITEARDAVQGLRSSMAPAADLADTITTFGAELAACYGGPKSPAFVVQVEGTPRNLAPLLRDEVYRIAAEALRNAFRHANAARIEVEIRYDPRQLRLRVRDNGKGMDAKILDQGGRHGHYGLAGMHERATLAGGKLAIWSELDSGTEAELTIPASIAYARTDSQGHSATPVTK